MHTAQVEAYNKESFSEAQYFIFFIISIANNCRACMEFVNDLRVLQPTILYSTSSDTL